MQVDGEQQSEASPTDRQPDVSNMQTSDLKTQEGVGRCYYTQLPRLVKVICHPLSMVMTFQADHHHSWQPLTLV